MKRMLFNATFEEELRVASVEGQKLINFDIETTSKTQRRGNIYCGIVTRVEPSLEACFVDYGTEKQGFLPFKEIDPIFLPESGRFRDYSKLSEGAKLIIQVEKDERGNKGAALTTYTSLPGRYLVLMPNSSRAGGISRRIEGEERDELKAVLSQLSFPSGMSVIARTAALGRAPEELQWDLNYLLKLWNAITTAATNHDKFLIYQESNLVIRSIRDHFSPDVAEILIDEEHIYNEARNFMASVMPNYVEKIKFYHDDVQLFSRFQIEHQIESAYSRTVNLPSGGAIVIDHTEALTAIDVNSAKANKGADIEATALSTNLEAAEEIARQMRLRDLGGLVVVDFIDMENPRNQREVENIFKQQLGFDRARIQMGKLSKFGLLELSRQRLQASLEESTTITCPRCAGIGVIRGIESIAVHILRIIQEEAVKNANQIGALHIQVPVEVATYLLNEKREDVAKIESRMKVRIVLIPNVHIDSPQYKIKKISSENYEYVSRKQSFTLVDTFEESQSSYTGTEKKPTPQPQKAAVRGVLPNQPAPVVSKSMFSDLFSKIASLFKTPTIEHKKRPMASYERASTGRTNNSISQVEKRNVAGANKTRPVPITKSNTKIQTVRPSGNNVTNKVVKLNVSSDIAETKITENPRDNMRRTQAVKTTEESRSKPQINENPQKDTKAIPPYVEITKTHGIEVIPNPRGGRGYNNKPSQPIDGNTTNAVKDEAIQPLTNSQTMQSTLSVKDKNKISNIENNESVEVVVNQVAETIKPIVEEVASVVKLPKKDVRNTILDNVDLGELELVNTKNELLNQAKVINVSQRNVKRHNDLSKAKDYARHEVNYDLVETKRSS